MSEPVACGPEDHREPAPAHSFTRLNDELVWDYVSCEL